MDKTIIYINTEQKKRIKQQASKVTIQIKHMVTEEFQLIDVLYCGLEREPGQVNWNKLHRQTKRALKHALKKEQIEIPYQPKVCLNPVLAEYFKSYPNHAMDLLLPYIYHKMPSGDCVFIRDGLQDELPQFIEQISEACNRIVILLEPLKREAIEGKQGIEDEDFWDDYEYEREKRIETWNALSNIIYDNCGLLIELVEELPPVIKLEKDKWKKEYHTLFFDFVASDKIPFRNLPNKAVYMDMAPTRQKERIIREKRRDITYLTYANYLDICEGNRV